MWEARWWGGGRGLTKIALLEISSDLAIEPGALADTGVSDQDYLELGSWARWFVRAGCPVLVWVVWYCICRHCRRRRFSTVLR